jgi:hypothetical protein
MVSRFKVVCIDVIDDSIFVRLDFVTGFRIFDNPPLMYITFGICNDAIHFEVSSSKLLIFGEEQRQSIVRTLTRSSDVSL